MSWRDPWGPMFKRSQAVLHLSKHEATIWSSQGTRLSMVDRMALQDANLLQLDPLAASLQSWPGAQVGPARWHVVLDSAWMPMTHLDARQQHWSIDEVNALACHRWASLYGAASGPWHAQTLFLPGDPQAWAFGMRGRLKAVLAQWIEQQQHGRLSSLQPSVLWATMHERSDDIPPSAVRVWCEQDRCVIHQQAHAQWTLLDPAADVPESPAALRTMLSRAGVVTTQPVHMRSWIPLPAAWRGDPKVVCHSVVAAS